MPGGLSLAKQRALAALEKDGRDGRGTPHRRRHPAKAMRLPGGASSSAGQRPLPRTICEITPVVIATSRKSPPTPTQ